MDPVPSADIRTILAFCLPGIGNTLLCLPAFRALKMAYPECRITAVTMIRGCHDILTRVPEVDEALHFSFLREGVWRSLVFLQGLRRRRFDVSFLGYPSNRPEYNLVQLLTRARLRLGHRYNHWDRIGLNWLNSRTVREDDAVSDLEENLRLVELVTGCRHEDLGVRLVLGAEEEKRATQWLEARELTGGFLIGMHPGSSTLKNHVRRRWPPERFGALGRRLLDAWPKAHLFVFGGPEEAELKQYVARTAGKRALPVDTDSILVTGAILQRCRHFVSNDSGLMHLAGALGIPTTAVFGPTNERWMAMPRSPRHAVTRDIPCRPCFHYSPRPLTCRHGDFRCLTELSEEPVFEAVAAALHAGTRFRREGAAPGCTSMS